jgi:hypothetical protein
MFWEGTSAMASNVQTVAPQTARQPWRFVSAGILSGACVILTLMVVIALLLFSGALWQYAFNSQIPVIQDTAWLAVMQDLSRLPSFFWGGSPLLFGMMVIGGLLALLDLGLAHFDEAWRTRLASMVVYLITTMIVIGTTLINSEQTLIAATDQSGSIATLAERQPSVAVYALLGIVVAFALAGSIWGYWRWWYSRWCRWLGTRAGISAEYVGAGSDELFASRQRSQRIQRMLWYGLFGSIVCAALSVVFYNQARGSITSGEIWVEPNKPIASAALTLQRPEHYLYVENTYGVGSATVQIRDAEAITSLSDTANLAFNDSGISFQRTALPIASLAKGQYQLYAELGSGTGGRIGYALIEAERSFSQIAAWLVGLSSGLVLALVVTLWSTRIQADGKLL